MAIDQGTTVIIFNRKGEIHASAYHEIQQMHPRPGWVEHNPLEYRDTVMKSAQQELQEGNVRAEESDSIGVTNKRDNDPMGSGNE